jgi:hypothetical protein
MVATTAISSYRPIKQRDRRFRLSYTLKFPQLVAFTNSKSESALAISAAENGATKKGSSLAPKNSLFVYQQKLGPLMTQSHFTSFFLRIS